MEISKNKRTRILEATIKLLTERDIADVTTRSIAKEAGISKGTLFHYFNTKDSLFYFATEKIYLDMVENFAQISAHTPNEEVIRKITYEILNFFAGSPGMMRLLLNVITRTSSQSDDSSLDNITQESIIKNFLYPIYSESAKIVQSLGYENPMILARLYIGIMDGIGLQIYAEKIQKGDPLIEEFAEEIIKLFTM